MNATALIHDSLAEIHEDKLVDRVVTDVLWGREFFQFYGMPSGMVNRQCVSLHSAPGTPKGDIDVLFCAPDLPEQAVAYQIKRIKLGINQLRNGTPSKLAEFKKLAQQTNLIARMGFWQVYADVIVVADAREQNAEAQNTGKLTFQGLSSELRSLVYSAVSSAIPLFDSRIGIGVMEFIQTIRLRTVHRRYARTSHSTIFSASNPERATDPVDRKSFLDARARAQRAKRLVSLH